jgi:hypothetical protein
MREVAMDINKNLYLISIGEFSYVLDGKESYVITDFPLNQKYLINYVSLNILHLVEGRDYKILKEDERKINLLTKIRKGDLLSIGYIVFKYVKKDD